MYLNGHQILKRPRHLSDYRTEMLPRSAVQHLRKGENVLAVHCHQTRGGQYIDVGLSVLTK